MKKILIAILICISLSFAYDIDFDNPHIVGGVPISINYLNAYSDANNNDDDFISDFYGWNGTIDLIGGFQICYATPLIGIGFDHYELNTNNLENNDNRNHFEFNYFDFYAGLRVYVGYIQYCYSHPFVQLTYKNEHLMNNGIPHDFDIDNNINMYQVEFGFQHEFMFCSIGFKWGDDYDLHVNGFDYDINAFTFNFGVLY